MRDQSTIAHTLALSILDFLDRERKKDPGLGASEGLLALAMAIGSVCATAHDATDAQVAKHCRVLGDIAAQQAKACRDQKEATRQ